jgi:hypothetical protein
MRRIPLSPWKVEWADEKETSHSMPSLGNCFSYVYSQMVSDAAPGSKRNIWMRSIKELNLKVTVLRFAHLKNRALTVFHINSSCKVS